MSRGEARVTAVGRSVRRRIQRIGRGAEAIVLLTIASAAASLSPARRVSVLMGHVLHQHPTEPALMRDELQRAVSASNAIRRAAALLPWHPTCLRQAIALRWMLRRRGIACHGHLGVESLEPFEAHAWITAGGRVIHGGPTDHITHLATLG
jgi:hypothetical protein